ncbi:GNAT family N-acetyltransferase [uncultured Corynebacterium sp.]|uniref:GNAT family N-acetyltransferase n=1 Tax=uncultured Corynebacterium sp. TaxID=159447 RepID=UPI0025F0CF4E|nr:GNAT family N-acetyltransferase [uncultured Corynebacterium sp.]
MTDITDQLTDRDGTAVEVRYLPGEDAYGIFLEGEVKPVGKAHYLDRPGDEGSERVFHHTVVDEAYGGRGLAGILVGKALADAAAQNLTVVPVCSYVARWIEKNNWSGKVVPATDDVQEWVANQG